VGYYLDPVMWALAISLATFAGVWTFFAYRRRGAAAGMRGLALVVLPFALLFTGTLTLLLRILDAVTAWAAGLVFSPLMWAGLALLGLSVSLYVAGRSLGRRQVAASPKRPAVGPATGPVDPEMAEIEAILRNRGIT
jgi:hypothetical protein